MVAQEVGRARARCDLAQPQPGHGGYLRRRTGVTTNAKYDGHILLR
jgi:hypothetical protein